MSDTTSEVVTIVGSVDGPRAKILEAVRQEKGLTMGNFVEFFSLDEDGAVLYAQAMVDLLDAGEIHSVKGRHGGLKDGPKPAPTGKSLAAMALAKVRAAKG